MAAGKPSYSFPPIWSADPHTLVKHELLREYWKAWLSILGQSFPALNYLDGFAGPGSYEGGEPGSPLVVVGEAIKHPRRAEMGRLTFGCIEKEEARVALLQKALDDLTAGKLPKGWTYFVRHGEFAPTFERALDEIDEGGGKLAPTFAFLDPFGFSGMPLSTIRRLLAYPSCEVLVTFMVGFEARFLDELRAGVHDGLFESGEWRDAVDLHGKARTDFLVGLYRRSLQSTGGAKYVRSFEVCDRAGRTIYHLVFGTTHPKGLIEFKQAMYRVDRRGTCRFSDQTDVKQHFLIEYLQGEAPEWIVAAAQLVFDKFAGQTVSTDVAKEFVWLETPFIWRKEIFRLLVSDGRIQECSRPTPQSQFGAGVTLTFAPRPAAGSA